MNKDQVIRKIEKLLALANSTNEHEARLAAERANVLLVKFNLSMQELGQDSVYKEKIVFRGRVRTNESMYITSILVEHFFVKIIRDVSGRGKDRELKWVLVGEESNVQIAEYVFGFLQHQFEQCWKQYKKETGATTKSRQAYYIGLHNGLNEQLKQKRKAVEQEMGLTVVPDAGLLAWMSENNPNLRKGGFGSRRATRDDDALNAGFNDGKNMKVRKGLGSDTGSDVQLAIKGK